MKTTVFWMGIERPRLQVCMACRKPYDAIYGEHRPHNVCAECWAQVSPEEKKRLDRAMPQGEAQ